MKRYRKKPVEIEAMQVMENPLSAWTDLKSWIEDNGGNVSVPILRTGCVPVEDHCLYIETLEGRMRADVGDWIIRGIAGEFYPCKPDIFAATYEPVDGTG